MSHTVAPTRARVKTWNFRSFRISRFVLTACPSHLVHEDGSLVLLTELGAFGNSSPFA
jgi:hypothetical protein